MGLEVHIFNYAGPPQFPPTELGQHWVDTLNRRIYFSIGIVTIADWIGMSEDVVKIMNCAPTVAIDDLVYQSPSVNNFAVEAVNNTASEPVIGHVLGKPTTTTCLVQLKGIVSYTASRGKLFLNTSGTYTTTAPTAGYVQCLGWSDGAGEIEINPSLQRVLRS